MQPMLAVLKEIFMKKKIIVFIAIVLLVSMPLLIFAHSGRTDGAGGHHDYNNVSGLGSYHYHHGYGPHLHPGGVCPYDSSSSSGSSSYSYEEEYNDALMELEEERADNELLKEKLENQKMVTIELNEEINDLETQRIWYGIGGGAAGAVVGAFLGSLRKR